MPKDPVCGMDVNESTNLKLTVGSETYYFCSKHCLEKFAKEKGVNGEEIKKCISCAVPQKAKW